MAVEVDYLVVGAGATAMAFIDAVFHETDATFAVVDRRHAPGGHWNDAYPFVALHQPASCYGVASRPLGSGRLDESGYNQGLETLASGTEVTNHLHGLMRDVLLPSGRVAYHPMSEYVGDGDVVSLLSGDRHHRRHNGCRRHLAGDTNPFRTPPVVRRRPRGRVHPP
jgi:hypothetical protein